MDVWSLTDRELRILNRKIIPRRLGVIIRQGQKKDFPKKRDFAYTTMTNDGIVIAFAPKLHHQPQTRIRAIMRHELAHALYFLRNQMHHSEQDTDDLAEQIWGEQIYYDTDDIQTLGNGTYPRPRHLPR